MTPMTKSEVKEAKARVTEFIENYTDDCVTSVQWPIGNRFGKVHTYCLRRPFSVFIMNDMVLISDFDHCLRDLITGKRYEHIWDGGKDILVEVCYSQTAPFVFEGERIPIK